MFSCDVLNIILTYVQPTDILTFFLIHNLNFNIIFRYDGYYYNLTFRKINNAFSFFPNVKLVGINVSELFDFDHINIMLKIILKNILRVKITHNTFTEINCVDITSFLLKCSKIKELNVVNCYFSLVTKKTTLNYTVQHLILTDCYNVFYLFDVFRKLKIIKLDDCSVGLKTFNALSNSKCHLKHLIFNKCEFDIFHVPLIKLVCNTIKILEITNCDKSSINIQMFFECEKVKIMKLHGREHILNIALLNEMKYLRHLDISGYSYDKILNPKIRIVQTR